MSSPSHDSRLHARYGPWAVVTGASDGIGRAFARRLAGAGLSLILVARRRERLEALVDELRDRHDTTTVVVVADLATSSGRADLSSATADHDVGLLIAAAGFGTSGWFVDDNPDEQRAMLAVNCIAVLDQSLELARRFVERGRGGLVLMSSIVAFQGVPRAAGYAATKAYVQTLAEALHRELAPRGVDVLACAPGPVRSGFAQRADMRLGATVSPEVVAAGALAALGRRTTVAPGPLSKLLAGSLRPLPRAGRIRVMEQVMRGMTTRAP